MLLAFIVLALLLVNLLMPMKQSAKEKLKRARIKMINICVILVLETILVFYNMAADRSCIFNILIILSQVIDLVLTLSLVRIYKEELKLAEKTSKYKNESHERVVV